MKASLALHLAPGNPLAGLPLSIVQLRRARLLRYQCAELLGFDPRYRYARRWLPGHLDLHAGAANLVAYFTLDSDALYEARGVVLAYPPVHVFCTVAEDGTITRLSEEEARVWLRLRNSDRSA